jgi:hypothetical protein
LLVITKSTLTCDVKLLNPDVNVVPMRELVGDCRHSEVDVVLDVDEVRSGVRISADGQPRVLVQGARVCPTAELLPVEIEGEREIFGLDVGRLHGRRVALMRVKTESRVESRRLTSV